MKYLITAARFAVFVLAAVLVLMPAAVSAAAFDLVWSCSDPDGDAEQQARWWVDAASYSAAAIKGMMTVEEISAHTAAIGVGSWSEGSHIVNIEVFDGYEWSPADQKTYRVDGTPPAVNSPSITAVSATGMTVRPDAADSGSGLYVEPYMYNRDDVDTGLWQTGDFTDSGLIPNTRYEYRYRARDAVLNISGYSAAVAGYTLALDASAVEIVSTADASADIAIVNDTGNGNVPENKVEVKLKGAGIGGVPVAVSDWDVRTQRTIVGLDANTEYEIWATTRNGGGVENLPVKLMDNLLLNNLPAITIAEKATDRIISSIVPHNRITLSGRVFDIDSEPVTVSASVDGVYRSLVLNPCPVSLPEEDNWSLTWDGIELSEGVYTNIVITAADSRGGIKTATYTGTLTVDRTAPDVSADDTDYSWRNSSVAVNLDYTDTGGSGVNEKQYRITDSADAPTEWDDYTGTITLDNEGLNYIHCRVTDHAGNTRTAFFGPYKTDRSGPVATHSYNAATGQVTFNMTDAGSGLKLLKYYFSDDASSGDEAEFNSNHAAAAIKDNIAISDSPRNYTGSSLKNTSNYLYIHYCAEDTAGNPTIASRLLNNAPVIILEGGSKNHLKSEAAPNNIFELKGKAYDEDAESITISASINGIFKSITIDTSPVSEPDDYNWILSWNISDIPEGDHTGIGIGVTDARGAHAGVTYTGTLTVDRTKPVIVPTGTDETVRINMPYADAGASASDNLDGDITDRIVTVNPVDTSRAGEYVVTYDVTDTAGNKAVQVNRKVFVRNYAQERLNNITEDSILANSRIDLPVPDPGQEYRVTATDADTGIVVLNTASDGGTVYIDLQQGHSYHIEIKVNEGSVTAGSRVIDITRPDATAPSITGAYILNGVVYIVAGDNYKLAPAPYAFVTYRDGSSIILGEKTDGAFRSVIGVITPETMRNSYFTASNSTPAPVPCVLTAYVRDSYGNIASIVLNITDDNVLLSGTVTDEVMSDIEKARAIAAVFAAQFNTGGGGWQSQPGETDGEKQQPDRDESGDGRQQPNQDDAESGKTARPEDTLPDDSDTGNMVINTGTLVTVTPEAVGAIAGNLSEHNLYVSETTAGTEGDSPDGMHNAPEPVISVNITKGVENIKEILSSTAKKDEILVYYRLDLLEKYTNKLVYTRQYIIDPENVIIPNLADATAYIVRISVMADGEALAFREIEHETADLVPPVIEKVILSRGEYGTDLMIVATDNMELDEKPYQYKISGKGSAFWNPFGRTFTAGVSNAGLWNTEAWTAVSRLKGLESGTRVAIKVRDRAGNCAETSVDIAGESCDVNTDINARRPLSLGMGASNVLVEDIMLDVLQNIKMNRVELIRIINMKTDNLVKVMESLSGGREPLTGNIDNARLRSIAGSLLKSGYEAVSSDELDDLLNRMKVRYCGHPDICRLMEELSGDVRLLAKMPRVAEKKQLNVKDYEIKSMNPEIGYIDRKGRIIILKEGKMSLEIRNRRTGEIFRYDIRAGSVPFDRCITVEKKSMTDLNAAFNNSLMREFGKRDVEFICSGVCATLDKDGILTAKNPGLCRIIAKHGTKSKYLYVLVMDNVYPMSDVKHIEPNTTYVVKKGDVLDIHDLTSLYRRDNKLGTSAYTDYMVVEPGTANITILDGQLISAQRHGLAKVTAIDLVGRKSREFSFMVEDYIPVKFSDIKGSKYEKSIQYLASRGILMNTDKGRYHPGNNAAREEFISALCKVLLIDGRYSGAPLSRPGNQLNGFAASSRSYYYIQECMKTSSQFEMEAFFGQDGNYQKSIATSEVKMLMLMLKLNSTGDNTADSGKKYVTKGEMAEIIAGILKSLENKNRSESKSIKK